MHFYIGIVKDIKIEPNLSGDHDVSMLTIQVTEEDDTQTMQQVLFCGDQSGIVKESTAFIMEISEAFKVAIGFDDGIKPEVDEGERKVYSQAAGAIKAFLHLKNSGAIDLHGDDLIDILSGAGKDINLNGDDDNAVRYSKYESQFNSLKDTVNDFITNHIAHTHIGNMGADTSPPSGMPPVPSTEDPTPAKVDNVRLPI